MPEAVDASRDAVATSLPVTSNTDRVNPAGSGIDQYTENCPEAGLGLTPETTLRTPSGAPPPMPVWFVTKSSAGSPR